MVTVFTPTFNRLTTIKKLYMSLKKQTCFNFEWIVLDDHSTDGTEKYFRAILQIKNKFNIRYKKFSQCGKHRLINRAIDLAKGNLFFIVDSDDYLSENAIETILKVEAAISPNKKRFFAGICGPRHYFDRKLIGTTFIKQNYLDIRYTDRIKYNISGDKSEVFYTNILKKYKFPEFQNEYFLTEAVVWDRIAKDGYLMRYFNAIIYYCEYRKDGLSFNLKNNELNSPYGQGLYVRQKWSLFDINKKSKFKLIYEYYNEYRIKYDIKKIAHFLNISIFYLFCVIIVCKIYTLTKNLWIH